MSLEPSVAAAPLLIDSDAGLDRFLRTYPQMPFTAAEAGAGIPLDAWQALGEDAVERSWRAARTLGVPLVRLVTGRELPKLCPNCGSPAASFSLDGSIEEIWAGCDSCSETLTVFRLADLLGALNNTL